MRTQKAVKVRRKAAIEAKPRASTSAEAMPAETSVHRHTSHAAAHGYIDHCVAVLRDAGARVTQPRLAVLRTLAGAARPMAPRQLLEALRADRKAPDVDQVTIYRILETFTRLGLVHQIGPDGEFVACSHLSCASPLHIFARCLECGAYEELDVPVEIMAPVQQYLVREVGFEPREHLLSVSGACTKCRTKSHRSIHST